MVHGMIGFCTGWCSLYRVSISVVLCDDKPSMLLLLFSDEPFTDFKSHLATRSAHRTLPGSQCRAKGRLTPPLPQTYYA